MLARAVHRLPAAFARTRCSKNVPRRLSRPTFTTSLAPSTPLSHRWLARPSSSSSSTRWKARQTRDTFSRAAKTAGLKSRAAFKLLEIDAKHRLFRPGDTVVDLGYAPGSWSQVAVNRTSPGGRVVGIDVIPVQPPRGVSTLQGDFLSREVREEMRRFVREPGQGRVRARDELARVGGGEGGEEEGTTEEMLEREEPGYLELEKAIHGVSTSAQADEGGKDASQGEEEEAEGRVVDVVLSDMSEPWPLTTSTWIKSVSNPYLRMMNTSGITFADHAGSMDLCNAALEFCRDTLATGGHFLCKFYQGAEDHAFELRLKKLFEKVHRIKPDSSRKESKEAYFVALKRRDGVPRSAVLGEG